MELMIIIVQEQDYPKLSSTFIHNRVMATKFSTEGLYLNKKNITLMVCIEKEREEEDPGLYPPELYRTNGRTSGLRI